MAGTVKEVKGVSVDATIIEKKKQEPAKQAKAKKDPTATTNFVMRKLEVLNQKGTGTHQACADRVIRNNQF